MLEIFHEALRLLADSCLTADEDADGFRTLTVSSFSLASQDRLNSCFAVGVLTSWMMIKSCTPPLWVSPALIQSGFIGVNTVLTRNWIKKVYPRLWETWALFSEDDTAEFPDHQSVRNLVSVHLPGTTVRHIFIFILFFITDHSS